MIYAIDFGTSNSLLAAADPHQSYAPIPLDDKATDPTILRSILFFPSMTKCYYGSEAISQFQAFQGKGRLIRSIKKYLPMRSFVGTWIEDRPANLEDLISFFLREMRVRADRHFGVEVTSVVMGRPAKFSLDTAEDAFAQFRLEQAAKKAGFKEVFFCPEPVAAAFDYRTQLKSEKIVLVADFGGGTSDFTVIKIGTRPHRSEDVLSIGGVSVAGDILDGDIMRHRLAKNFGANVKYQVPFGSNILSMPTHLIEKICSPADLALLSKRDILEFLKRVQGWSLSERDKASLDRLFCLIEDQLGFPLFESIENSKRQVSESAEGMIDFHYPSIDISEKLMRTEFEKYADKHFSKILESLDETVKLAGIRNDQIDLVCCTGGTAKVPALKRELIRRFGEEKIQNQNFFNSVVKGLAELGREILNKS